MISGCSDDTSTSPTGPSLTLSRPDIEFLARAGSNPNPAQLKVTVKINGSPTANFTVTSSASWLDVDAYGTDTIYVTARAELLPAGIYHDTLRVSSDDATNDPVPLPVLLTVSDWLWSEPAALEFSALVGGSNPPNQRVDLYVFAGSSSAYSASTDAAWLTISKPTGSLPDSLEIGVDVTGLAHGQYTDSIIFNSDELPDARLVLRCELNVSSWARMTIPDQIGQLSNYEGICLLSEQLGFVVGWFPSLQDQRSVVYKTTDGGQTWIDLTQILDQRMGGVSFVDEQTGWVAGRAAGMVTTSDGGVHWTPVVNLPVGSAVDLRVVKFLSEDTGWVIGTAGTILRTYDGGANWTKKTPTTFDLTDICIVDKSNIWVSANHGVILYTSDGGDNWVSQPTGTIKDLRSVHFVDLDHGWAVGVSGTVISTEDGGANWVIHDSGFITSLHDVWFANTERGWTVGLEGLILRTDDGGATWTQQLSGTDLGLYELEFVDENFGMIVGESGTLLRTASGGF